MVIPTVVIEMIDGQCSPLGFAAHHPCHHDSTPVTRVVAGSDFVPQHEPMSRDVSPLVVGLQRMISKGEGAVARHISTLSREVR